MATDKLERRAEMNQLVVASVQRLGNTEYLAPYPPGIEALRRQLEVLVTQVGNLESSATTSEVNQLANDLNEAVNAFDRAIAEPPIELKLAAESFLSGQYTQVLEALAQLQDESTKVAGQAHLLQAAALFAIFRSANGMEPELLQEAKRHVMACHALEQEAPNPSPKYFSPRFIEFFEAQRQVLPEAPVSSADS